MSNCVSASRDRVTSRDAPRRRKWRAATRNYQRGKINGSSRTRALREGPRIRTAPDNARAMHLARTGAEVTLHYRVLKTAFAVPPLLLSLRSALFAPTANEDVIIGRSDTRRHVSAVAASRLAAFVSRLRGVLE